MKVKISLILLLIIQIPFYAQVKIGDNPSVIHPSSVLELESPDKVLVISRVNTSVMNSITPLEGALVYNTDVKCVFFFNGTTWENLCNNGTSTGINVTTSGTAPTSNNTGDFWIDNSKNNAVSIWNGTTWIRIDSNPTRGNGPPLFNPSLTPIPGDVYVDQSNGRIYAYNGTNWVAAGSGSGTSLNINANNGLAATTNGSGTTIELGGVLIKPTIIEASAVNTLSIIGLQDGDTTQDDIVTVNKATGQLRKVPSSGFFREEVTEIVATDGQLQFTPSILISDSKKVNVYRNGVRIDFTVVNNTTIEIEPEAVCYQGDQIRIVQFY